MAQPVTSNHIFFTFDLDLWPTTLTFYPSLARSRSTPMPKFKVNGQTHRDTQRTNTQSYTQTHKRFQILFGKAQRSLMTQLMYTCNMVLKGITNNCLYHSNSVRINRFYKSYDFAQYNIYYLIDDLNIDLWMMAIIKLYVIRSWKLASLAETRK